MFSKCATSLVAAWRRLSLTARMTLFFAGTIALIVVGVSAMMYAELTHQLREKEESELLDAMRIQQEVFESIAKRSAPTAWQHEWDEQQQARQQFAWLVTAANGARLRHSPNLPLFQAAFAALPSQRSFVWRTVPSPGGDKTILLHTAQPEFGPPGAAAWHGALDVTQDHHLVDGYRRKLYAVVLATIVLSTLFGWVLARRGLRPLRAISGQIGQIHPDRLQTRIAQSAWPAELHVLAVTFDELMERIARSFDQLSRFSSDLAHEFRTPINNLVAAGSVTLGRARTPAAYQTTLAVVVEEGERLSRTDNSRQAVRMEAVSTATEFGKLIDFFDIVAEEHGVTLTCSGDLTLAADPMLLRQALSNLVANALRHTARGGRIALDASDHGDAVALTVSDDGCGIAQEHLPFIFDRFYRVDAARSAIDSTGLGLSVVRSIADLHGGTVTVSSRIDRGTTFTLLMPKARAAE